ncbi:MAG TPA: DnaA/Hda family protein [Thermoanaerobaculia bacterium]|jgi:chromosomal replication initiator protein
MTFDRFIADFGSSAARDAALAVACGAVDAPNPLYLYGGAGCGKTHLLRAIAGEVAARRPEAVVSLVDTRLITSELVRAIRVQQLEAFREWLAVDVLLVDDFNLSARQEVTRRELFRTFSELAAEGTQVVVAAHARPQGATGTIVEITCADAIARQEIARRAAEARGLHLHRDAIRYIAEQVPGSPRELQGFMARLTAERELLRRAVTSRRVVRLVAARSR